MEACRLILTKCSICCKRKNPFLFESFVSLRLNLSLQLDCYSPFLMGLAMMESIFTGQGPLYCSCCKKWHASLQCDCTLSTTSSTSETSTVVGRIWGEWNRVGRGKGVERRQRGWWIEVGKGIVSVMIVLLIHHFWCTFLCPLGLAPTTWRKHWIVENGLLWLLASCQFLQIRYLWIQLSVDWGLCPLCQFHYLRFYVLVLMFLP